MSDWENEKWTANARHLVEWAMKQDKNQPLMLLIRHSHREELRDHQEMLSEGITEQGKQLSKEMGRRLPISRPAHFFFSIVPRCYETAEAMAEGFSEQGGKIIDMDPLPTLVRPEYTQQEVWQNLNPNGENVTEFVNRWADGKFEGIEPFPEFKARLMKDTIGRLLTLDEPQLHIHVTHDLSLMSAKRALFEKPLIFENREPYLGGLGLTIMEGKPTLFVEGRLESVSTSIL